VETLGLFDLSGKVAIVTGGARGIGMQLSEALADCGANVVVCGRDAERGEQFAAELSAKGPRALGLRCNVADPEEVEALVARTVEELGSVDIVVNNAGATWGAPAEDMPMKGWEKTIGVNLTGTFLVAQAAGRSMIARGGGGKIINIASTAAFASAPAEVMDAIAYTASKGGVVAITRDLAIKWAKHGINVNALAPGWFPTDMSRGLLEEKGEGLLARIPLNRFGGPDDLKGAIAFLASPASDFMTGQTLVVDGGEIAW
jgi:gluconate 5-dehydrogenase